MDEWCCKHWLLGVGSLGQRWGLCVLGVSGGLLFGGADLRAWLGEGLEDWGWMFDGLRKGCFAMFRQR